jgi:hypothetical protein
MSEIKNPNAIVGREMKHGIYTTANDGTYDDAIIIKEYLTREDGTREPHVLVVENWKRPFWYTLEAYRNHKDKKFAEKASKLRKQHSTQINLTRNLARAFGRAPGKGGSLRMTCRNPYIYGCDVTTPVLFKQEYLTRWPTYVSDNTVAALDIETTTHEKDEDKEVIMGSLTMRSKVFLVVVESYFKGHPDPEKEIRETCDKYLRDFEYRDPKTGETKSADLLKQRNIQVDILFVKNEADMCLQLIMKAHEWKPDFLDVWNMNFDIKKIGMVLTKAGYDLADVFSDPAVPRKYRFFNYIEGASSKVTASGKQHPLSPAEQWHTADCPASFYIIDSMCVYLKLRIAKGKEPKYALDFILEKELGMRKLKFKQADHIPSNSKEWHDFMRTKYKAEYCVYNIFDCISLELLDEHTTDLSRMISSMSGPSEYRNFGSQPRRTCDDLHFECLEKGYVIATTSDQMQDENDQYTVSLRHWIVTLPSHLVADTGVKAIKEWPQLATLLRAHVADLDVEGTYPNEQVSMNIEKATTAKEVCKIDDKPEAIQRAVGINLSGGHVNAMEICISMYSAPTMERMLADFNAHLDGVDPDAGQNFMDEYLRQQADEYVAMAEQDAFDDEDEDEDEEEEEEA